MRQWPDSPVPDPPSGSGLGSHTRLVCLSEATVLSPLKRGYPGSSPFFNHLLLYHPGDGSGTTCSRLKCCRSGKKVKANHQKSMSGERDYADLLTYVRHALRGEGRKVVTFDADGTLWRGDLGEAHLIQVDREEADTPGYESVHSLYLEACRDDVEIGYRLGTHVLAPRSEEVVYASCERAWGEHRTERFSYVLPLLREIEALGGECWIVSASHRWIIEVAARDFGIPSARVIAGDLECIDGRLTSKVIEPFPNGSGKAQAIAEHIGVTPRLAFGNSRHDLAMLECAEHGVIIWDTTSKPESLLALGRERGWAVVEGQVQTLIEV